MIQTGRIVVALCLLSVPGGKAQANCHPPEYREVSWLADSKSELIMNISIRLQDFAPSRLICLVQDVKERHGNPKSIVINIFSSKKAASRSIGVLPPEYSKGDLDLLAQMHGDYFLDADKRDEYIEIRPFGLGPRLGSYDTKISLPAVETPHCRLEMAGRCILALKPIFYPDDALKGKVSGTVTLTGTIARSGRLSNISVAETSVEPTERKDMLVNDALRNLRTWQLEPAARQDPIRITYSYLLVTPGAPRNQPDLQFDLPSKITIRGDLQ